MWIRILVTSCAGPWCTFHVIVTAIIMDEVTGIIAMIEETTAGIVMITDAGSSA